MNVAVVGSRTLDIERVEPILTVLFAALDKRDDPMILIRCARGGTLQPFEAHVYEQARNSGLRLRACQPDTKHTGRAATFTRDVHMVETADAVIAFFDPEHLMQGGTGHVVEKAIEQNKPVTALEIGADGLRWIGSVD